jgi:hypothetical protein
VEISFEDWVAGVFDHPVTKPEWYWGPEVANWNLVHERALQFVTQLFGHPADVLRRFSDAQLNQGFWFLLGANGDAMRGLDDEHLAWELRWRCIRSFSFVFESLFAARCTPHLSHLQRADTPGDPGLSALNQVCYMWWDFDCWCARPEQSTHRKIDAAFLEVMRQTLALPQDACRESALHGLGHWHAGYPTETEFIIDIFLHQSGPIREELREYAQQARRGCVL